MFDRLFARRGAPGGDRSAVLDALAPHLLEPVDPSQAARYTIPVLDVRYLPTRNGHIDVAVTGDVSGSVEQLRSHIDATTRTVVNALESGSCPHRYRDPGAAPAIRYRIVDTIEILEPLPTWSKPGRPGPMTDYLTAMERIDIEDWVLRQGVKEVWLWGYHGGVVDLWESNLASRFGDISNSDRDPSDLPVLSSSYTVYHYNYGRGPAEAVEDHIHQYEALWRHLDPELFWDRFVGRQGEGRCGWAHYPPNGRRDYDWANPVPAWTDIEDWRPEGGERKLVDARRWGRDSLEWFVYWMQNVPAPDAGLRHRGRELDDWWAFVGDFDAAMGAGRSLLR